MAAGASGKAVVLHQHGGLDVLKLEAFNWDAPKTGEVLVKLAATSVNPVDVYVRNGTYASKTFPLVLGGDASGTVHAVSEGSKFAPGDKVFALSSSYIPGALQGTYAEFATLKEEWLAPAPTSVSLAHAAAVPLVALTALQCLEKAAPKPGQRVLVTGASGGVGHVAVQLAKALFGLHVVASCSPKHDAWMQELGAEAVSHYTDGIEASLAPFSAAEAQFDIIVDVVGGGLLDYAVAHCLKPGGFVSEVMNRGTDHALCEGYAASSTFGYAATLVQPSGAQLVKLAGLMDAGQLRVKVAQEMPLEKAGAAQDIVIEGHAGGKVILIV